MKIDVRFFARARDIAGSELLNLEIAEGSTIADLRSTLCERIEGFQPIAGSLLFAVGTDYVKDAHEIEFDSEVVCFPPVSGG